MDSFFENKLVDKFEEMLEHNNSYFFDIDEFCEIISFYLDIYDFEYALKALNFAKLQHPDAIDIKIKELEYLVGTEKLHQAFLLIKELNNYNLSDIDYMIAVARYWSLRKFSFKAIDCYLNALSNGEYEDYILNCIGNEYIEIKEYEKAMYYFKQALELDVNDEYALFSMIHCYESLKKNKECILFINSVIDKNPYSEEAWFQLGLQYLLLNQYREASVAFDFAIVINPKSITAYTQKAYCFEQLNEYEKAIDTYRDSIQHDDTAAFTYYQIGQAYMKLDNFEEAITSFSLSIKEDPQFDKSWYEIYRILKAKNRLKEALKCLQKALDIEAKNEKYLKEYILINLLLNNKTEAESAYSQLVELNPENLNYQITYFEFLISNRDYKKAINLLQIASRKYQKIEFYYLLSNCYFQTGNKIEGKKYLLSALALEKNSPNEIIMKYPVLQENIAKYKIK